MATQQTLKITARKYEGDDAYSWAVFVNGYPAFTGLNRSSVNYYKDLARRIEMEKRSEKVMR